MPTMPRFLKKLFKFIPLGLLMIPVKQETKDPHSATSADKMQSVETNETELAALGIHEEPIPEMQAYEYGQFFVHETKGIVVDGKRNKLVSLQYDEKSEIALIKILKQFHPEISESEAEEYLQNYKMLIGEDVDYFLEEVRKGSWGTTIMSVTETGEIHFKSISLRQFLLESDYEESRPGALNELIQEEFLQAQQYDAVIGKMYNMGYLKHAGIIAPSGVVQAISVGNMRAFLELYSQQKFLLDSSLGRNSYNYYIGSELFEGPASSAKVINDPYFKLNKFIDQDLGIHIDVEGFFDADEVVKLNEMFRSKYLHYYINKGFSNQKVQIWNLVGMKRYNQTNPENSLDMKAILELPE